MSASHGRVGIVYRSGKPPLRAWSGIPAGLAAGLAQLGFEHRQIDAEPPRAVTLAVRAASTVLRRGAQGAAHSPEIRATRRRTARMRAGSISFDAVIQMGSDYGIPFSERFATYDDQTVAQLRRVFPLDEAVGTAAVERWLRAQRECYTAASACCAMSSWAAKSIVRDYDIDPAKVHVVGAGRNYEPRPAERDWSQPRFLFVGGDWQRKNGPLVVEALTRLRRSGIDATLDVVGDHPRIAVDGVRPHGRLDWTDTQQRGRAELLFERATCLVLPSVSECFGIAYVEAAAAGVPSIGTCVGGARDAIGDGGILVPPNDIDALYGAMVQMSDPGRASMLGTVALGRAPMFTWRAVAERVADALDLMPDASRRSHPAAASFPGGARARLRPR